MRGHKRALLVGIDHYDNMGRLNGCVNDVTELRPLLARNEDGSPNFTCETRTSASTRVERDALLEAIDALLAPSADVALLYFAGHGAEIRNDVALVAQDSTSGNSGVAFSDVLGRVRDSKVPEVVIILDCCFSGAAGGSSLLGKDSTLLRHGLSILTASRGDQVSAETPAGRGLFSTYLCGALDGGAADVLGHVTMAGVYAYLSESFSVWEQRPMFKANIDRLHDLRQCSPAVPLGELRRLPELFLRAEDEFLLDPSFEPEAKLNRPENERTFKLLQRCRAAKLVEPVGAEHMYFAAINSKSCRLTQLGRHYWRLAKQERL